MRYSCALGPEHLWRALAYVERNPVRAGMVARAEDYVWSSARAHIGGADSHAIVDMEGWERCGPLDWQATLGAGSQEDEIEELRRCTDAGRPSGMSPLSIRSASKAEDSGVPGVRGRNLPLTNRQSPTSTSSSSLTENP